MWTTGLVLRCAPAQIARVGAASEVARALADDVLAPGQAKDWAVKNVGTAFPVQDRPPSPSLGVDYRVWFLAGPA